VKIEVDAARLGARLPPHLKKLPTKEMPLTVKARTNGSDGTLLDVSDLVVAHPLAVDEKQYHAEVRGKPLDGDLQVGRGAVSSRLGQGRAKCSLHGLATFTSTDFATFSPLSST